MVEPNFSWALDMLKQGHRISRSSWKNIQFVVLMEALQLPAFNTQDTNRKVNDRTAKWIGEGTPLDSQPYLGCFTADKKWQPGWMPSQADLFATDWDIIEDEK